MGTGIIVCGLNGVGKSTLGKTLAERLNFHFIDNEDLYFSRADPDYASPRAREEAERILFHEINAYGNFVFASVKGDYGEKFHPFLRYAILIEAPKDIRIQRVRNRSFQKFGSRMLAGGDLHRQEESFFDLVKSRSENTVETWIQSLKCPIIRIDGTKPIKENVDFIVEQVQNGIYFVGQSDQEHWTPNPKRQSSDLHLMLEHWTPNPKRQSSDLHLMLEF